MAVRVIMEDFKKVFYCGNDIDILGEEYEKNVDVGYAEKYNCIYITCGSDLAIYEIYSNYDGSIGIYHGDGGGVISVTSISKNRFTRFLDTTMYKNMNFENWRDSKYIDNDNVWKEIRDYILYLFNNKLDFEDSNNSLLKKCVDIAESMYGFSKSPGSEKKIKNSVRNQSITFYDGKNSVCSINRDHKMELYRYSKNYEDMINSFIKLGFEVSEYI